MRVGTIEMHGDVRAVDFSSHRAVLLATSFQFIRHPHPLCAVEWKLCFSFSLTSINDIMQLFLVHLMKVLLCARSIPVENRLLAKERVYKSGGHNPSYDVWNRHDMDSWNRYLLAYRIALTLAGTGHFSSFHCTRGGGGGWYGPRAVSPLIELELRGKNERVARRETKRLIYKLKVLGQPVTSEVMSSSENWRKSVIADNFASDGPRAKFIYPVCFSRRAEHVAMVFECPRMVFMGQKFEK